MNLIECIASKENLNTAFKKVVSNKGAAGIDGVTTEQLFSHLKENNDKIIYTLINNLYQPQPVRRVYIPKSNGKQRPLGIPTCIDRVIQQSISQVLIPIYEPIFSDNSYGFRPNRSCHDAISKALEYLNSGYEWVIDIDIEQFFDKVNHDKLIQILRENVNDSKTLKLILKFLRAGIMHKGVFTESKEGVPQGGPLSVILSNIYLDKLDKQLEERGLRFARYADDCNIFVKSENAANRVIKSITSWIERKLFLKVNATKTKVVRPTKSQFLGFTFTKQNDKWEVRPLAKSFVNLYSKCRTVLIRRVAAAKSLAVTFKKVNEIVKGWINYYKIGKMKYKIMKFGEWLRHKIRVIILKQWKKPKTKYTNFMKLNKVYKCNISSENIRQISNTRLGLYKSAAMNVVNFLINVKGLETKKKDRPALVNPLNYYLR